MDSTFEWIDSSFVLNVGFTLFALLLSFAAVYSQYAGKYTPGFQRQLLPVPGYVKILLIVGVITAFGAISKDAFDAIAKWEKERKEDSRFARNLQRLEDIANNLSMANANIVTQSQRNRQQYADNMAKLHGVSRDLHGVANQIVYTTDKTSKVLSHAELLTMKMDTIQLTLIIGYNIKSLGIVLDSLVAALPDPRHQENDPTVKYYPFQPEVLSTLRQLAKRYPAIESVLLNAPDATFWLQSKTKRPNFTFETLKAQSENVFITIQGDIISTCSVITVSTLYPRRVIVHPAEIQEGTNCYSISCIEGFTPNLKISDAAIKSIATESFVLCLINFYNGYGMHTVLDWKLDGQNRWSAVGAEFHDVTHHLQYTNRLHK